MRKGFTLIELLAVLVILAIIAVIAVPIVLGIIEDSRNEANERSIEMYAKAVKNGLATYQLENDDEVAVGTYSSKTLPFKVSYDGDVECDTIKIRENKKLTLSNCKVNGEEVNYIYGVTTLGDHIISSNGGYSKAIDLKGKKKILSGNSYLGESITLYFSDEVEIDYENHVFKLVGNVQQKTISYNYLESCSYENSCNHGKYGAPNIESSYVYKNFSYEYYSGEMQITATEEYFGYKYDSKAGTGLYKIEDDLGDSYYFRGDVKNNYLVLANKKIIHHDAIKEEPYIPVDMVDVSTICGENEECLLFYPLYAKLVFPNKEECVTLGTEIGGWTTCEKLNVNELYSPVEDSYIPFKTEQDCTDAINSLNSIGAGYTTCEKRKLKNEAAYDEEVITNRSYYRIVRINGDGTIRLIYDGDSLVENGKKHTATTTQSLDTWYQNNIVNYSFDKYIANTVFYVKDIYTGYYADPAASVTNNYTYKTSDLKQETISHKKIGLLSASEAAIAGALGPISNNYLSGSAFKTANLESEFTNYYGTCKEYCQGGNGSEGIYEYECGSYTCTTTTIYYYAVNKEGKLISSETGATRPVINLIEDVPFTGTGTITNPYVVTVEIN